MLGRIVHFAEYLVVGYLNVSRPGARKLALKANPAEKYLNGRAPYHSEVMSHGKSIQMPVLQKHTNNLERIPKTG